MPEDTHKAAKEGGLRAFILDIKNSGALEPKRRENFDEFLKAGADVITTGNHVWDEKETMEFITSEKRLLRPQNLTKGSPGNVYGIFNSKNKKKS